MLPDAKSLDREEWLAWFKQAGQPDYRVDQLLRWIHEQRCVDWQSMTNLPKSLREDLRHHFSLHPLELMVKQGGEDTTRKFLWKLRDGALVESVLIPANPALYGETSDRHTLCVSTQVGCAYGCRFCASGLDGWKRNLNPEEIVEQVYAVERWHARERDRGDAAGDRLINNLVIMGMGEPLANYANLLKALCILNAPWGGGIGARKITVSTSGLAPQIRQLAEQPHQFRLAISLHGATNEVRNRLMPVNRKYPLETLQAACEYYLDKKGQMITLEYILIQGVNDSPSQAAPLARLAKRLKAKVNLIPYNTVEGLDWVRPSVEAQDAFLHALRGQQITATLRREKGHDIDAACGQLRLKTERQTSL